MKKLLFIMMLPLALMTWAQDAHPYFTPDQMPNAVIYLPKPPREGDARMKFDEEQYRWGREKRGSKRGETARADAEYSISRMAAVFSKSFGVTISPENTPQIWRLLADATLTASFASNKAKSAYMRPRPYMVMGEPTLVPEDEEELSHNGSYPSGHTVLGWTTALLLSEINPEAQDRLLLCGYEYGQSRVIAGFHWQSDVDAGRLVASAAFARLHTSKDFCRQMKKAQKEFRKRQKKEKTE